MSKLLLYTLVVFLTACAWNEEAAKNQLEKLGEQCEGKGYVRETDEWWICIGRADLKENKLMEFIHNTSLY